MAETNKSTKSPSKKYVVTRAVSQKDIGFVHGEEEAKIVRKENQQYIFENINNEEVRSGAFDHSFPPDNTSLRVVSKDGTYGFCVSCAIECHVLQLLEIKINENVFVVRLEVTAHWLCSSDNAREYEGFYETFRPSIYWTIGGGRTVA